MKFAEEIIAMIEEKMADPSVKKAFYEKVMMPLKKEIDEGNLDHSIAGALARVSTPVIVCIIVLFIMLIALLNISVLLLIRMNRIHTA